MESLFLPILLFAVASTLLCVGLLTLGSLIGPKRDTAVKEIYTHSAKLAVDMASRIMRKELNGKEHERLISESIDEIEQAVPR